MSLFLTYCYTVTCTWIDVQVYHWNSAMNGCGGVRPVSQSPVSSLPPDTFHHLTDLQYRLYCIQYTTLHILHFALCTSFSLPLPWSLTDKNRSLSLSFSLSLSLSLSLGQIVLLLSFLPPLLLKSCHQEKSLTWLKSLQHTAHHHHIVTTFTFPSFSEEYTKERKKCM